MNAEKILSSLCYFSVFFAPFLLPIIVFIIASGDVRHHAGKALWTHLVPYLCVFIGLASSALYPGSGSVSAIMIAVFAVIGVYYIILNLVRGVKVLLED